MKRDELRNKSKNLDNDAEGWKIKYDKTCKEHRKLEEKLKKVAKVTQDLSPCKVGLVSLEKADHRSRIRHKRFTALEK